MERVKNRTTSTFSLGLLAAITLLILTILTPVFGDSGTGQWPPLDLNSLGEADWVSAFEAVRTKQTDFQVESLEEFKAITKYYNGRIRDGVEVHRFRLRNDDTVQCILIHTQGSLSATGSPPESIQLAPQIEPIDTMSGTAQVEPIDIPKLSGLDGLPDEDRNTRACPEGSFPRLMPKLENLYRFRKFKDIFQKYPNPRNTSTGNPDTFDTSLTWIEPPASATHEYAHAYRWVNNTGSSAIFNIWAPYVQTSTEFSLSQLWVPGGTGNNQQTVETGWQVYPQIYGDNQPHLFIYFTTHNYNSSYPGCYNLDCQGFVQTSSNVVIGGPISPVSTIGGNQYDIKLMFLRDAGGSHNWWLKVNDVWIGYYPNSLFNSQGIANYSNRIDYGGEVVNFATGGLHTTTQMGSGRFPNEGWQYAAFIRSLKYLDLNNYYQDSTGLIRGMTDSNYYDLSLYSSTDPNWLQYFYFGGPGRQLPNLAPYQSPGWSDKIVVSKTTGTNTDSSPLYMPDTLYVDWAVINNGSGATSARFSSVLYVDGVFRQQWYVDPPLNPTDWQYVFDYSIGSLSVGTHTIKIVVDSTNAVDESNETDNEYTKTITIASPGTIYIDTVQKIFIGYYQRPADPSGLIFWASKLEGAGGNLNEIIAAFANSAESQALYGTIKSSNISTVVNSIYNALFCRSAEAAGLNYYVNGFNSGQFTAATIMLNVLNGAQGEDLLSVTNKVTAANLFTKTIDPELDGRDFQATYSGNADAQKARDFLSTVCGSLVTIPTQAETRAYIKDNIADSGDPILR